MTDTQVADPLLGTLIDGRYRVRERVAQGGMATVYTAVDERLDRTVALKIVHSGQSAEGQFAHRFMDEAKAIARLTHPNVVAAYDRGAHHGQPYLVMEYVRGRTLREILGSRRRLTPLEALAIVEQMLAGIGAAHRAGLVHRDVKPENVLVAAAPSGGPGNLVDGVVKVTDFGLAQAVQASTDATDPGDGGSSLMATVAYVAPELVTGGRADPRSDVYSTGIVLFEMLTGRVPFDGGQPGGDSKPAEVAWQHVHQEVPPPSNYVAGMPPAVDRLVAQATQRNPEARPPDAGALLNDVQAIREQVAASTVRPRPAETTMVMAPLPDTDQPSSTDRPAWARLPSSRPGSRQHSTAGPVQRSSTVVAGSGHSRRRHGAASHSHSPGPSGVSRAIIQRRRMVVAAAAAVLVLLVAIGGWWFALGRWMPAPELVGMPEPEAVAAAEQHGLTVQWEDPAFDDEVPAGHVLAQDPTNRVLKGGTITLTLSQGPEIYPVPDIIGATAEVAHRQLEGLSLVVVEAEPQYSDSVPEGRVLSVEPEVGTEVRPGAEVTITVSNGQAPVGVPSLIGKHVDQARTELEQAGLVATVEQVESNEAEGTVIGQDPQAGAGLEPGDSVTLEVSEGPPTRPVPDVVNQDCEDAEETLEQAGFEVEFGFRDEGRVALQNPSAGTGLPPGSQVTIFCT